MMRTKHLERFRYFRHLKSTFQRKYDIDPATFVYRSRLNNLVEAIKALSPPRNVPGSFIKTDITYGMIQLFHLNVPALEIRASR